MECKRLQRHCISIERDDSIYNALLLPQQCLPMELGSTLYFGELSRVQQTQPSSSSQLHRPPFSMPPYYGPPGTAPFVSSQQPPHDFPYSSMVRGYPPPHFPPMVGPPTTWPPMMGARPPLHRPLFPPPAIGALPTLGPPHSLLPGSSRTRPQS